MEVLLLVPVKSGGRPFDPGGQETEKERISFSAYRMKMKNFKFYVIYDFIMTWLSISEDKEKEEIGIRLISLIISMQTYSLCVRH